MTMRDMDFESDDRPMRPVASPILSRQASMRRSASAFFPPASNFPRA